MFKRSYLPLALFALLTAGGQSGPVQAQPRPPAQIAARNFDLKTAGDLAVLCNTPPADAAYGEAMGYCRGFARGALAYHHAITPAGAAPLFCPPAQLPPDATLRGQFATWVNASPRNASLPPVEGVFLFLKSVFPCAR